MKRGALLAALLACAAVEADDDKPTLLVAGGTGQTGREIVRLAVASNAFAVRGTTRNAAKARSELPGVEWFGVDVREPRTLVAAVSGADVVISAIGANVWEGAEGPQFIDGQGNINLVDAARAAGVKHFVLISSASAGSHRDQSQSTRLGGILKWKTLAEEHLKASGLAYTIIGPAGLRNEPGGQRGLRAVRRENYQSTMVARTDVARVAIDAITNPAALRKSFALYNDNGASIDAWHEDLTALTPDGAAAPKRSPLDGLAWMAGHWYTDSDGGSQEELWLAPKATVMPGVSREVSANGRTFFEYLRIESRPDGIYYIASPGGKPPTEFRLVDSGSERAVFRNPAHDFPRSLAYSREGIVLRARLDGEENGKARVLEYEWRLTGSSR